jgi:ADP-heptose:LPS heptosyltransferase
VNVLIINLTRFGDLIQTQPVISGYKSRGHRVGLVCLENFASATALLDGVDHVFPFPGAGLLAGIDADWRDAVRDSHQFRIDIFSSFLPDRTVNLTPSTASRLLAFDLTPENGITIGFSVDEFGFNADTSSWAAFLQMAGSNRGSSPFNICDLFRRTAGLGIEGNSLRLAVPDDLPVAGVDDLLGQAPEDCKGFVALQMGASEDRRRWPIAYFVQTARMLWERDHLVSILLGTKSEVALGERFEAEADFPFINCIGATSLTELACLLVRCAVLVTNDTGTMHLAAGLGVPVCAVFLATAQPWDTGPYRDGNICLEPEMDCHPCEFGKICHLSEKCRWAVTPEAMCEAVKIVLGDDDFNVVPGVRTWRTRTGADGFMGLESLSGHDLSDRVLWIRLQRAYYLNFFDGIACEGKTGIAGQLSPEVACEILKTLTNAHDMLFLLSQQGMLLQKNPRPQAKTKFLASWQRLQNILAASDHLNILGLLWMFESQRCGDNFASLLILTDQYRTLISSMRDEFM